MLTLLCKALGRGLPLAGLALLLATAAQAQAPGSTGPTPGAPQANPAAVPLDGGASLLLAGGVAYGLKRLRHRHRGTGRHTSFGA